MNKRPPRDGYPLVIGIIAVALAIWAATRLMRATALPEDLADPAATRIPVSPPTDWAEDYRRPLAERPGR
jgi:hypothetical protein